MQYRIHGAGASSRPLSARLISCFEPLVDDLEGGTAMEKILRTA